jgi:hypothetical protein
MASGQTLAHAGAWAGIPPATNYASQDTRNGLRVCDFDPSTDEDLIFECFMPRYYNGGGVTLTLWCMMTSAVADEVIMMAAFERGNAGNHDMDADDFASAQSSAATTVHATSGQLFTVTITFTDGAQMDSVVAGDPFRLKITRDANAGGDDATGDLELWRWEMRET